MGSHVFRLRVDRIDLRAVRANLCTSQSLHGPDLAISRLLQRAKVSRLLQGCSTSVEQAMYPTRTGADESGGCSQLRGCQIKDACD